MQLPSVSRPERILEIDALRGLAALCVVVFHLKVMTDHPGGVLGMDTAFGRWTNGYLWTAVDLFFVISGFIFAHVYLRDGRLKPGTSVRAYSIARVARIYPLHLLTLSVMAAIAWSGVRLAPPFDHGAVFYDAYHFMLNLLMLQASGVEHGFSYNSPSWSLTSEFVCYALFFAMARKGGRWVLAGAMAAIAIGVIAHVWPGIFPVPSRIARALVGFFVGLLMHRYRIYLQQIPFVIVVSLSIVSLSAAPYFERNGTNAGVMMALFAWPWVILTALSPLSGAILRSRPLQFIGDLSYSTYLIHIPLALVFLTVNGGRLFTIDEMICITPLYIAVLLIVSRISFVTFEEPARQWVRAIGQTKPSAQSATATQE